MYALASLGLRRSAGGFCLAGAALGALQGVGCTPWRPLVSAALPVAVAWQARHLVLCKGSDIHPGVPWSPVAFAWQARHLVLCKGSDVRPGVPWSPPLCRWLLRGRRGLCKGLDVRPGVPWSPPLCRWLLRGRRGNWCSARGRMYALASAALPLAFAWQVRHLVLCKGSDVRPGVPWSPPLAGGFCVAGAALGALQGVGCTPWRPLFSAALPVAVAWQARHLVLCKGSDLRPGVPWSPVAFAWQARHLVLLQGVGCTPWRPFVSGGFCVAGAALGAVQGVGCTPWRPLVSAALPVAFAWQARHLVLCKGLDVRPGVPWSPPLCRWLLRGRRGTWCSFKGSDVRPGVPLSPVAFAWQARHLMLCKGSDVRLSAGGFCVAGAALGAPARGRMYALASLCLRWLLRGRRGTWCCARGRMYALASLGLRRSAGGFCVAGAALDALQGVGCTPWRPLVSAALPVAFAWQARQLVLCKGSDVRPGVRRSAAGFCVAGAALGALQGVGCTPWRPLVSTACRWLLRGRRGTWCSARGRVYALASLCLRWLLRGRRGTWCSARGRIYALASLGLQWLLRGRRGT